MKNHENFYRMRIGNYRIIFKMELDELIIVEVIFAGSRGDIYNKI
ncbi:MAG: type II toxin-antitoxin system RelE family toxin [Fusobacteriaceae bacterium]